MNDFDALPDHGLGWLEASGAHADIVLSTRVRLARNLQGHAFGPRARVNDREAVLRQFKHSIERSEMLRDGTLLVMSKIDARTRRILLERRLATRDLLGEAGEDPANGTAVHLSSRDPVSVMINEEDHLRVQSLLSGLRIQEAWEMVDRLDEELGRELPFAYHNDFGFLTSCPTNVGSGLRASVFMHLPGLVLTKEIGKALRGLGELGLTFRGLYGEGSEVVGNFFQVSNQTTLGRTEEDLVDHLDRVVRKVIDDELRARRVLLRDARGVTEDKIWRAYGLLRYARSLSFEELMNLLSGVRLGVSLKLLPELRVYTLNKMMIFTQPAHLEQAAGRDLPQAESDAHRAAYVRRILDTEGDVSTGDQATDDSDLSDQP
ncbi:MAG: protein arginine kinase [Gemmatimonadetes bacterium]|nr:protein arginine kinase [Gemmatimonadota bacterium]MDA1104348.1 protein arginine kinase [Gemmatimonadota bacterium]